MIKSKNIKLIVPFLFVLLGCNIVKKATKNNIHNNECYGDIFYEKRGFGYSPVYISHESCSEINLVFLNCPKNKKTLIKIDSVLFTESLIPILKSSGNILQKGDCFECRDTVVVSFEGDFASGLNTQEIFLSSTEYHQKLFFVHYRDILSAEKIKQTSHENYAVYEKTQKGAQYLLLYATSPFVELTKVEDNWVKKYSCDDFPDECIIPLSSLKQGKYIARFEYKDNDYIYYFEIK